MTSQAVHSNIKTHLFRTHWQSFNASFINKRRGYIKAFTANALLLIGLFADMGYVK